jgi:hypothetical protein
MNRKILLFLMLLPGALLVIQAGPAELRHESKRLGLRFQLPQNFIIAQPVEIPGSKKMAEAMAKAGEEYTPPVEESLVERRFAAGQDLQAMSRDVVQISLSRHRGTEAEFDRKFLMKAQFRQQIGAWEAYVLPGAPGPYGDKALYSLVALKDGSVLQIMAPRFDPDDKPTQYDRVIRRLIESLEVIE